MNILSIGRSGSQSSLLKSVIKHRNIYIMVLPCIVFFIVFSYIPMSGIVVAFKDYSFAKGIFKSPWEESYGLQNFIDFFNYFEFGSIVKNTFVTGFVKSIIAFPFPILFALLVNEIFNSKFKKVVQTVSYMPYFLSWAVVSLMVFRVLSPDDGLLNQIKALFGGEPGTFYMMEEKYFYIILLLSLIWKSIGWNSIIYLAAISGINPELYEAARIDGAGKLRQTWHVTLAGIKPTMGILFIMSIGSIVTAGFEQNYLLRTPGNMRVADIIDVYVVIQGFQQGKYAYATAIGLLQGIIGLIMVVTANRLSKKYLEVSIW